MIGPLTRLNTSLDRHVLFSFYCVSTSWSNRCVLLAKKELQKLNDSEHMDLYASRYHKHCSTSTMFSKYEQLSILQILDFDFLCGLTSTNIIF